MKFPSPSGLVHQTLGLFGYEMRRRLPADEACMARMAELRSLLQRVEPGSRSFLEFCVENLEVSRADRFQDLFALFERGRKREGYFVEFGGADGISGSNTYALETEFAWTGIVAEPARCWHDALDGNRRCIVDHRCVTDRTGAVETFRECEYPANSTIEAFAEWDRFRAARRRHFVRYPVATVSLTDLLIEHSAPADLDYLSLDTEGSELMILSAFDFRAYRPKVVTVEHCHSAARKPLYELLSAHGYRRKHLSLSHIEDWYVLD